MYMKVISFVTGKMLFTYTSPSGESGYLDISTFLVNSVALRRDQLNAGMQMMIYLLICKYLHCMSWFI